VEPVTGSLPPAEREERIASLVGDGQYVLVCTDCLSEGINLQDHFDAVMHYDLAWNPTRHEQREGRVDRFGQKRQEVRVLTYYGEHNPVDGVILDVLIKKHKAIKSDLGVTVAVPGSSEKVAEAVFEGALFRERAKARGPQLAFEFADAAETAKRALHTQWDDAREREKVSRSRFAQHVLKPEAVAEELQAVRDAIGRREDVERLIGTALQATGVPVTHEGDAITIHVGNGTPRGLRQAVGRDEPFSGRFDLPVQEHEVYLDRTSPVVEGLAGWVLDQALDASGREVKAPAARCGVISTSAVTSRTTILLARFRYQLGSTTRDARSILAEEIVPLACVRREEAVRWLPPDESEALLLAKPERNLLATAIDQQLGLLVDALPSLREALAVVAEERAQAQLQAHERVREASRGRGRAVVEPVLPVDILGAYVLLPRLN